MRTLQLCGGNSETSALWGMSNKFVEPEINKEASEFISNNYNELLVAAREMGVDPCKAEDCVQDVCTSIIRSEARGEGFDMTKGKTGDGIISVRQFVFGRLKGYSKHRKYKSPTESPLRDPKKPDKYVANEIASSTSMEEISQMSACQKAYNTAKSYDALEVVEASQSFEEELQYVLSFENTGECQLSIKKLLLNIEYFKQNMDKIDIKSLFSELTSFNTEFVEAFSAVVKFSSIDPVLYNSMLRKMI